MSTNHVDNKTRWKPLLTGAEADAACAAIDELATALRVSAESFAHPSLSGGTAGRALFYHYLARATSNEDHHELANEYLDRAIAQISEQPMAEWLYGGFSGVAWVTEHLRHTGVSFQCDDPNIEIDQVLSPYLATSPWRGDYDLICGLTGCGVYALERMPLDTAMDCMGHIVDRLAEEAVYSDSGVTWLRKPEFVHPITRSRFPAGFFDLGVAHGVPGVMAVLAGALAHGVQDERVRNLLNGAWAWMTNNRLPADEETTFSQAVRALTPGPSRSAWCYGDPGVSIVLYVVAQISNNNQWKNEALAIARRAASRPIERCGCIDAGICHGAAGLALIYSRLWNYTQETIFADAARRWYAEIFRMRHPGKGIAGFQAFHPDTQQQNQSGWMDDSSFLTGAEGVGLVLRLAQHALNRIGTGFF